MEDEVPLILVNNDTTNLQQIRLLHQWLSNCKEDELLLSKTLVLTFNIPHVRMEDYYEEWLANYLDFDFFRLFRVTKHTFQKLLTALQCKEKIYSGGEKPVPMEKALLMTIWWLGKGEVLLSVADKFNVTVSTVFKSRSGYPGVIGAVDVCNIKFKAPIEQQDSYIDKNCNHSIKLQGIVTPNKIFTNVMIGYPGSAHDSRVFKNSKIYLDVQEHAYHLIGDKAYPLKRWILTPY
ncbi:hypothetical protein ILUMI_18926, partial [Ignelater luminosus]